MSSLIGMECVSRSWRHWWHRSAHSCSKSGFDQRLWDITYCCIHCCHLCTADRPDLIHSLIQFWICQETLHSHQEQSIVQSGRLGTWVAVSSPGAHKVPLKVPGSSTTRLTKIWPPSTVCPQSPSSLVLYRGRFHCLSSFLLSLWGVLYAVWIHLSPLMENNCKANKSSLPHWAGPYSWGSAVR